MSLIASLLLCCSPLADTLPPLPAPPALPLPEEAKKDKYDGMFIDFIRHQPIAPGCETHSDYDTRLKCTRDTVRRFVQDNFYWPAPDWCGEGTAVVTFSIGEDGRLTGERIARSLGLPADKVCRSIMEKLEREMPVWTPATYGGKVVAVQYNLPIRFRLE